MKLRGLAKELERQGMLDGRAAEMLMAEALKQKTSCVSLALESGQFSSRQIALMLSKAYRLPFLDLRAMAGEELPLGLLSDEFMRQRRLIPLKRRGRNLFVGISDPLAMDLVDQISFQTAMLVQFVFVEDDALSARLDLEERLRTNQFGQLGDENLDNLSFETDSDKVEEQTATGSDDAPIVRFINKVLVDAINAEASDIHFEPYEKYYRIRIRQDGVLHEIGRPPISVGMRLASRMKIMAQLNITERRIPQDGRIRLKLSKNHAMDFRVNTLPTLHGEKVVLRLLDSSQANLDLDKLGMTAEQNRLYRHAISRPYGMILVTGPTGSGKTVTLYSALNQLNEPGINICAAEDPVEIPLPGINQVNINNKVGLTFAHALRSFLRQDPDIIMVGEIRDLETAEIAVKAAQTGHLVFSTLHTNDAPQTLTRLANMGLPAYNIAASVLLIMAQRLVRKLCSHCKAPHPMPDHALEEAGFNATEIAAGITPYKAVGCERCTDGYRGRTGIFQVLPVNEQIERMILEGGTTLQLDALAHELGFWDLRRSGLEKVKDGTTSLDEINRVTLD